MFLRPARNCHYLHQSVFLGPKLEAVSTGTLSIQNVTGDVVYVYEPGEAYSSSPAHFSSSRKTPAQLRAGTYMLGTSAQEFTTFEIQPGEELVIELSN